MTNKSESQRKRTRRTVSPPPFHQRFSIKVQDEDAKRQFVNRVENYAVQNFFEAKIKQEVYKGRILWQVANELGRKYYHIFDFDSYVQGDFNDCLRALEAAYRALPTKAQKEELEAIVQLIISESEIDLGISWREGAFWPSGAKLLDEALVNQSLQWLSDLKYNNVFIPFQKGLKDFLEANKHPERFVDTIRDMYEALEKLARIFCNNKRNLKANAEQFVSKLDLSTHYSKMLKNYTEYAHEFRHAVEEGKQRVPPSAQEVEAFIYTTGLFIRLAIERLATK